MPKPLIINGERVDRNDVAYVEEPDVDMPPKEKQTFLDGTDVSSGQEVNPWSIKVDPTEDEKDYKKEHPIEEVPILNQELHDNVGCTLQSEYNNAIANLSAIIAEVVAGNTEARESPEFRSLNFPAIKAAIDWLIRTNQMSSTGKVDLMSNAWMLNFKVKPPTPKEFLSDYYIGAQAESLHKPLADVFCEFLDPLKPYRTLVLTQCIGWGKAQPYSSKVGVDYENVIDFTFDDGTVLTFNENDYVLSKKAFIKAKNVKVNLPQATNLIIMNIYDCRKIDFLQEAFKIDNYNDLIDFFKKDFDYGDIICHKHHIIPRSEGGLDNEDNLVKLPVYFHIKAHYLRAIELEKAGNKSAAYKNYKAIAVAIDKNKIPENYKEFLKELDFVVEALQRKHQYDKDTKWMTLGDNSIKIYVDDVDYYKSLGYIEGRKFNNPSGKVWVNKDGINTYVLKEELDTYIQKGYIKGMYKTKKMKAYSHKTSGTSNMKWVMKDGINKNVLKEDLQKYLNDGWIIGRDFKPAAGAHHPHKKQGLHWYTNGINNILSKECPDGYRKGRV